MGPQTAKLIEILDRIISLLEADEEDYWSNWMIRTKARLLNSDFSGIELLLSAYGGMGSFNDLIIAQSYVRGELTWKPNYQELNNELDRLRGEAFQLATWINHNHELRNA